MRKRSKERSRQIVSSGGIPVNHGAALDPGLVDLNPRSWGVQGGASSTLAEAAPAAGSKNVHESTAVDPKVDAMERNDDQATKGTRWMPRRQEARKDVGSCEKRRGAANQALIRRCPNGETHGG